MLSCGCPLVRSVNCAQTISLTSEARAPIPPSLLDNRKIPLMSQSTALALASLLIGLLWSYRAVTRKEYSDFVLAAVFLLLAILLYVRK